jgi:phage terminase large subunit
MQAAMPATVVADFPAKLRFLFRPARYKVAYGGRGGAKSWGIARALLILGAQKPLRVLCAREIQKSISDSVHKLLSDQILSLGLSAFYEVQNNVIRGRNGTEFTFHGLKHNIGNIKSVEGTDICWVEEAQNVSKSSWETLVPTIRKPGSEIWVSFNPALASDETFKRFVAKPPPGAEVVKINWSDNPWFPEVLRQEMLDLKSRDEDAYLTVWEGHCKQVLDGAVYAGEIRRATEEGRFTRIPYDAGKPVSTFWDLGRADMTAIWFAQVVGFEFRLIDYYESRGHALGHYLKRLQERPYVYGTCWLPHDARNELLASERTIEQQMRAAGREVRIVPKVSVADGINAARTIFGRCWFDAERCADGLNCLRHYRYDVDPDTQAFSARPLHDWASHGADAFRYLAIALTEPDRPRAAPARPYSGAGGWMA